MADFYVSIAGNDAWSGRSHEPDEQGSDGPFASLGRAKEAVRELLRTTPGREISVDLRGGIYHIDETLVFSREDSGSESFPVTYRAYPGEMPVLSGGARVQCWRRPETVPHGLPKAAEGHVWTATSPAYLRTLYRGLMRLDRARTGGFIPLIENSSGEDTLLADRRTVRLPPGAVPCRGIVDGLELLIIPKYPWFFDVLELESVDDAAKIARTTSEASYPMEPVRPLEGSGRPTAWIENCIEALDAPGRWAIVPAEGADGGTLYLWPEGNGPGEEIIAPRLCELVRVEGDAVSDNPVRNLRFEGITFAHGERYVPSDGSRYGYGRHDAPNAMVRFRGAEHCVVERCRFVAGGDVGIRIDAPSRGNRVIACTFEELGGTGIMLCGRREIDNPHHTTGNEIADNLVHHCAAINRSTSGIYLWQSDGNHVHHNEIRDMPHNGMMLLGAARALTRDDYLAVGVEPPTGNETDPVEPYRRIYTFLSAGNNVIEYNEIHRVMELLGDGNGLYIDAGGDGNLIRRNYFHDITGFGCQSALRTDDFQCGTAMRENVIVRCVGGGITLKQTNNIENNIIASLLPKRRPDGTMTPPDGYLLLRRGPSGGSKIRQNILYHAGGAQKFYCEGRIKRWPLAYAKDCDVDYNIYYCTEAAPFSADFLDEKRAEGIDTHSVASDPLFEEPTRDDFRMKADSPAFALGIVPIDPREAGPRG
jgi:hypothetical protein